MRNHIITISRQYGSGGKEVGRKVAQSLGIPCYDKEIINQISEKSGFSKEYIRKKENNIDDSGLFGSLAGFDLYGYSNRITIWTQQCEIIKKLAREGNCVIIGRCADYVLKNEDLDVLKVFVYADSEQRVNRIVNEYGETNAHPEKIIKDWDKRRSAYYEIYTDQKYGDLVNYDICVNSGTFGIEKCAELIEQIYRMQ